MENEWKEFQPTFKCGIFKKQPFLKRIWILLKSFFGIRTTLEMEEQKVSAKYKLDGKICTVVLSLPEVPEVKSNINFTLPK